MHNILIYGGSFDPPHYGHINTAIAVQQHLHFERFVFLPCKTPVLKNATIASAAQRLSMLQLAIGNHSEFAIDQRELNRTTPSYMVDTLTSFREDLGEDAAITVLLGTDTFLQLPQWHYFEKLLTLCNLLVIKRAKISEKRMPYLVKTLLLTHEIFDKNYLLTRPYGQIYQFDAGQYAVSSSELRQMMLGGQPIEKHLPPVVYQYIKEQALYQ